MVAYYPSFEVGLKLETTTDLLTSQIFRFAPKYFSVNIRVNLGDNKVQVWLSEKTDVRKDVVVDV